MWELCELWEACNLVHRVFSPAREKTLGTRLGRRGGLIFSASALDSGAGGPGSSPGRGHCVVFFGNTLYSHVASFHPGV